MRITCPECRTLQAALAGRHTCKACRTDLRVRPNLRRNADGTVKARRPVVTVARHYGEAYHHAAPRNASAVIASAPFLTRESATDLDVNGTPYREAECMACGSWTRVDHLQRGKVPDGDSRITVDGRPHGCRSRIGDPMDHQFKATIPRWIVLERVCGLCRMATEAAIIEAREAGRQRDADRAERQRQGRAIVEALGLPF